MNIYLLIFGVAWGIVDTTVGLIGVVFVPSRSRAYVNECLNELVAKQFLKFEDDYAGPYRYRITQRGSRYLALSS